MSNAAGLGWMVAVVAWAVVVLRSAPIAGFPPGEVAFALGGAAVALMLTGWAAERARGGWRATLGALGLWVVLVAGLSGALLQREALVGAARSFSLQVGLIDPEPIVGAGGEVSITRSRDGHFAVPARINDREVQFLFDTGASTVVLGAETARGLGFAPETLSFRVPVATANGRGLAAAITLDRLAVGPIEMRRVPALVVRSGLLDGNLLGQTFLERLDSYEVRGRKLVLRARKA